MRITNENLVNNSNQTQNEILINRVDKLLIERLPDYINEELKWIRKEYGDDKITEFLCEDDYYLKSPLMKKFELLYED